MKNLNLIARAFSIFPSLSAAEYQLHLTPDGTQVNWTLGDVLHTVHGTFKLKRGEITFNSESGKAGGEVVVDAASSQSGSSACDGRMHKNILNPPSIRKSPFLPTTWKVKSNSPARRM